MVAATAMAPAISLTSRERHNPPPRQKSCAACIKAKRRCDAGFPSCIRCSQRGIPCELPTRKSGGRRGGRGGAAPSVPTPASTIAPDCLSMTGTPPDPPMDSSCDSFGEDLFAPLDPMFSTFEVTGLAEAPAESQFNFSMQQLDEPPLDLIHQPSMVAPPTYAGDFEGVPDVAMRKLKYAIDQVKKVPSMMVLESQTPWCHPKLYEDKMPRSMQDAHACCALYMSKNRQNSPIILRTINARVNELMAQPEPATPFENLAHTQALLLYHIIRIFDGDIASRAAAERTQSALEDSAMSLLAHANFDISSQHPASELPLHPLAPTRAFWHDWIFHESARRTLLFTFFLLQTYRILAGHPIPACDGKLGMCHSFTLAAPLWHAPSVMEFAKAWGEMGHLVVTNGALERVFHKARAHHVDLFGKILLTSLMGLDETEGWFAARGGSLWSTVKEGL